jgi:hypothetical protein
MLADGEQSGHVPATAPMASDANDPGADTRSLAIAAPRECSEIASGIATQREPQPTPVVKRKAEEDWNSVGGQHAKLQRDRSLEQHERSKHEKLLATAWTDRRQTDVRCAIMRIQ